MNILYHLTILPPKMPAAEALSQEIAALRTAFNGDMVYLNPNISSPVYLPRLLFGFHKLPDIRRYEQSIDLHHVYNPDPFPFPILRFLRKPVIYSLSSGVGENRPSIRFLSRLTAVTVYDARSRDKLQAWGLRNVHLVQTGIDVSRFTHTPQPLDGPFRLLVASAPWTEAQFRTKGVDALLTTAQRLPWLHLIFLWRGVLLDEMRARVDRLNLGQRVQVIDRLVDVNEALAQVHATANLVTDPAIIKAYPHSLLDSLAAGKPVIVSRTLPMADYVAKTGCGVVAENVTAEAVSTAVSALAQSYDAHSRAARTAAHPFTLPQMIASFRRVYESVV